MLVIVSVVIYYSYRAHDDNFTATTYRPLNEYIHIRSLPHLMRSTTLQHDQQPQTLHFPMKTDDLAFISELDFVGACRSLVKRSQEVDKLGMSLRQCPEVLVSHAWLARR